MWNYRTIMAMLALLLVTGVTRAEIVVLRNGGVLSGEILESKQMYIVSLGGRNEIRINRSSVSFVCDSMQQAYEIQRERNTSNDADTHIELAQWCVRHNLFDEAIAELDSVVPSRQSDIRIGVLKRKVSMLREVVTIVVDDLNEQPDRSELLNSQQIDRETEQLLGNVSTASMATFKSEVQTRLLHGCATSGCHSATSETSFRLLCESPSRPVPRNLMFQNFAACYEMIDETKPDESELLKYLVTPHGGLNRPVYRAGSRHYQAIRQWVLTASDSTGDIYDFERTSNSKKVAPPEVVPAGRWRDVTDSGAPDQKATKIGVDPFDPDVFNRKYGVDHVVKAVETDAPFQFPIPPVSSDQSKSEDSVAIPRRLSERQTSSAKPFENR